MIILISDLFELFATQIAVLTYYKFSIMNV